MVFGIYSKFFELVFACISTDLTCSKRTLSGLTWFMMHAYMNVVCPLALLELTSAPRCKSTRMSSALLSPGARELAIVNMRRDSLSSLEMLTSHPFSVTNCNCMLKIKTHIMMVYLLVRNIRKTPNSILYCLTWVFFMTSNQNINQACALFLFIF